MKTKIKNNALILLGTVLIGNFVIFLLIGNQFLTLVMFVLLGWYAVGLLVWWGWSWIKQGFTPEPLPLADFRCLGNVVTDTQKLEMNYKRNTGRNRPRMLLDMDRTLNNELYVEWLELQATRYLTLRERAVDANQV